MEGEHIQEHRRPHRVDEDEHEAQPEHPEEEGLLPQELSVEREESVREQRLVFFRAIQTFWEPQEPQREAREEE